MEIINKNITKIYDYTGLYQISNKGDVMNIKRETYLNQFSDGTSH